MAEIVQIRCSRLVSVYLSQHYPETEIHKATDPVIKYIQSIIYSFSHRTWRKNYFSDLKEEVFTAKLQMPFGRNDLSKSARFLNENQCQRINTFVKKIIHTRAFDIIDTYLLFHNSKDSAVDYAITQLKLDQPYAEEGKLKDLIDPDSLLKEYGRKRKSAQMSKTGT